MYMLYYCGDLFINFYRIDVIYLQQSFNVVIMDGNILLVGAVFNDSINEEHHYLFITICFINLFRKRVKKKKNKNCFCE